MADIFEVCEENPALRAKIIKWDAKKKSNKGSQLVERVVSLCSSRVEPLKDEIPLQEMGVYFVLYFLNRLLLKIKRRKLLYNAVIHGNSELETVGLHSFLCTQFNSASYMDLDKLEKEMVAFYKRRPELSNQDLFSLISSLRKQCKKEFIL